MKPGKVFLIGYMGSGKSTLGKALAARTGIPFVDLDDLIEERAGMKIRDYFDLHGEDSFRDLESSVLRDTCALPGSLIVACGGGTPCFGDNVERMNASGTTVHLMVSRPRLLQRLQHGRAKRPLIARLTDDELAAFVDEQLARRMPHYSKAAFTFDSSKLENEDEIDEKCACFIKEFLS